MNRVITFHRANGVLMEYAEKPSKTSKDRKMTFAVSHNTIKGYQQIANIIKISLGGPSANRLLSG